jgi:hypothetical protein
MAGPMTVIHVRVGYFHPTHMAAKCPVCEELFSKVMLVKYYGKRAEWADSIQDPTLAGYFRTQLNEAKLAIHDLTGRSYDDWLRHLGLTE